MTIMFSLSLILVTGISFTRSEQQGLSLLSSGELKEQSDVFITSWFSHPMTCRFDHCALVCEGDQAMLNYCPFFPHIKNLALMKCTLASDQCTLSCDGRAIGNICSAIAGFKDLLSYAGTALLPKPNLRSSGRQLGNIYRPSFENQGASLWPRGRICYSIASNVNGDRIRSAMEKWTMYTGVTFQACKDDDCCFTCGQYVNFQKGEGCWSFIGRQPESTCGFGGQTLSVASDCSEGNIMHEIGHAVGLLHEHTRKDRDAFVKVMMKNVKPIYQSNFKVIEASTGGEFMALNGAYDYQSIMHYSSNAFAVNVNEPTILPIDRNGNVRKRTEIGQRQVLSRQDVDTVVALYNLDRPVRPAAPVKVEAQGAGQGRVFMSVKEWNTVGLIVIGLVVIVALVLVVQGRCCTTARTPRTRDVAPEDHGMKRKSPLEYRAYPETPVPALSGGARTTGLVKPEPIMR